MRTQLARFDVSSYYRVLLGGARPPERLPANVMTTWGMTETGSGIVYDGAALPGVDVASVNGELCVRTPTLFRSYRTSPRPSSDGARRSRRLVSYGRRGHRRGRAGIGARPHRFRHQLGRREDLARGPRSRPFDSAPVDDIAITGVPRPRVGSAHGRTRRQHGPHIDDAIRATAEERIGPWAKPKEIRYVTAIPRTSNGKIRRGDLEHLH